MTTSDEVQQEHELKVQPNWRFLRSHPAHLLSFGFGSGLARHAPGTFGTLVAFPMYWFIAPRLSDAMFILVLIWAFAIGVWVCGITGKALGEEDYGGIVWDEIVAMLLVLFFTPSGWYWSLLAFVLFRFFDILKPPPIRYFDSNWHGGLGVMFDDLLAAGYALLCMAAIRSVLL
ncbi:MAG: phosphatidylglycerophosphatase A [Gallionellales bacterium CG_4_10_14_3_um_filter_54_96]|nr:phosphatidylglycerophosphatase A [Gallionella sp.]OIO74758.1 MAG: phosphatidylglycerophosphatase A [Gallionellaceae bacterium CG1_02_56_997]PIV91413.1 MAG: phosphatidylglycerophosphatase A [Gallionellales bacterium CG17_big_fil_post_rev_8_21_14_2_50_54_146]PIX04439.1 MAG: phosphatidylglycerophosphatase A [Gallionellales bacterium CG_4_8_14_3_um_filter_54_18]PIY04088.1 MAG: phosphatidylglycerophosphatase A [Gallionellales bacterium CG_4_10_14_3_um_filter_54_96]PJC03671.1 MAG: phosphatidylgly